MRIAPYIVLALGGCAQLAAVPLQPADPRVVADIVAACTADGVFKAVGGRLVLGALPYAGMADQVVAAGVDQVCADPARFAAQVGTAVWVVRNLRGILAQHPA